LAGQASLAEEVAFSVQRNDCFLTRVGYNADLDLALLDLKNGVRRVALREDLLVFAVGRNGPPAVGLAEEGIHIER
jgi:hypothetical protein